MVRSVVKRGRDSGSVPDFKAEVDARIAAMARTQTLLTRASSDGVDLEGLVRDELAAHVGEEDRFQIGGSTLR